MHFLLDAFQGHPGQQLVRIVTCISMLKMRKKGKENEKDKENRNTGESEPCYSRGAESNHKNFQASLFTTQ
jgi:hypothetical protein